MPRAEGHDPSCNKGTATCVAPPRKGHQGWGCVGTGARFSVSDPPELLGDRVSFWRSREGIVLLCRAL